jgi:cytochrome b
MSSDVSAGLSTGPATPLVTVRVWDLPTRLFHWALAAGVVTAWVTGEWGEMDLHMLAGYCVLALLLFRLLWGVLGSDSARFATFLRGPVAAFRHLGQVLRRRPDHETTHSAPGGWWIAVTFVVLLVQAGAGLFADDEILATGPLRNYVPDSFVRTATWLHVQNAQVILYLVLLHLVAVLVYQVVLRWNLIGAMVTGSKRLPAGTPAPRMRSWVLALALFLLCAAAVQGIASLGD